MSALKRTTVCCAWELVPLSAPNPHYFVSIKMRNIKVILRNGNTEQIENAY
jgi:hypothetical protein